MKVKGSMVPDAEVRTYYDQPVIKAPVWTVEIPWYLFVGGLAGGSSVLSVAARAAGEDDVARVAARAAAAGALVSPALLISDLGRPERFLNMLRVFKPSSPMSMGSWILAGYGPLAIGGAVLDVAGWAPRLRSAVGVAGAGLGSLLATYTAVLLADTAVPVWHDAHRELPFAFAGGAAQSAGGVAVALVDPSRAPARTARWTLALGVVQRELASETLVRRLDDDVARPLHEGKGGTYRKLSRTVSAAGAALALTAGRRSRLAAVAGGALAVAGSAFERFAFFEAGRASAADPAATVAPQRRRQADRP